MRIRDIATIASCTLPKQDTVWLLNLDVVEQQTGKVTEYKYINPDSLTGSTTAFDTNTVLYSKLRPNLNKVVVPTMSGYATSEMLPLRPDPQKCTREYLAFYLRSNAFVEWAVSKTNGAKMPRLGTKDLLDKEIPVPSIQTQKHIVTTLTCVESLIDNLSQMLSHFDELVKSRFIEMFGETRTNPKRWRTASLESIASVGSSKRVFVEELQEQGIPFFRGTEVGALATGEKVVPELYITEEHYQALKEATGVPVIGDLLMPSICPDGRIWMVDTDKPFYFKDGRVLWVHPTDEAIDSCYLLYVLKNTIMTDYGSIASGTTFAELKIFALKALNVMLPPMELQKQFSTFIAQTDKSKVEIQNALNELEILKKSLMQQYFG